MKPTVIRGLIWLVTGTGLGALGQPVFGCSVPVFRYALERWAPSSYEVVCVHRGPMADRDRAVLARLKDASATNLATLNVAVRTVDLDREPAADLVAFLERLEIRKLPALVARYPEAGPEPREFWSGPLTDENIARLRDSPARRRVAQRLIAGETAAWVLLESGNPAMDEAAAGLLQSRLDHLQQTLKLPKLDTADIESRVISVPEEALRVAFSVTRVSRRAAAEEVFVRMLLGSEEDLSELTEPMAFAVFGRGRLLYALIGKGIDAENIDEACAFLVGPCSCVVKEENPGVDLLMAAHWDIVRRSEATADAPAPELTGMTALTPPTSSPTAGSPGASSMTSAGRAAAPRRDSGAGDLPGRAGYRLFGMAVGLGVLAVVAGATFWLRRRT